MCDAHCSYQWVSGALRHRIIDPVHLKVSRLCCAGDGSVYVVNGPFMYRLTCTVQTEPGYGSTEEQIFDKGELEKRIVESQNLVHFASREYLDTGAALPLQSICEGDGAGDASNLYSVDSGGTVRFHRLPQRIAGMTSTEWSMLSPENVTTTLEENVTAPGWQSCGGRGWAGIASMVADTAPRVCSVHSIAQRITHHDVQTGRVLRSAQTTSSPSAIFTNPAGAQIVGERGFLSIWDPRSQKYCEGRFSLDDNGVDVIHSLSGSGDIVRGAGSEKQIYIFDVRKSRTIAKMRTPAKFPIISLLNSHSSADKVYLAGHDNELLCMDTCQVIQQPSSARKDNKKRDLSEMQTGSDKLHLSYNRGIRSKAHWMGLDVRQTGSNGDCIFGLCAAGNLYVLQNADRMALAQPA